MKDLYYILGFVVFLVIVLVCLSGAIYLLYMAAKTAIYRYIGKDNILIAFGKTYPTEFIRESYTYINTKGIKTKGNRGRLFTCILKYRLINIRRSKK